MHREGEREREREREGEREREIFVDSCIDSLPICGVCIKLQYHRQ